MIGVLLGAQNSDRVEGKLENQGAPKCDGTSIYCSIGIGALDTQASVLASQSKIVATGLYIDTNSANNSIFENAYYCLTSLSTNCPQSGHAMALTLTSLCPSFTCASGTPAYSFTGQSLVVDSAVAPGTLIFGTPTNGNFAPTSSSTFTADYDPLLNTGGISVPETSSYVAMLTDSYILCSATSPASMTVTLPTGNQLTGKAYRIKNIGTGICTVLSASGNIDNVPSFPLTPWQSIDVVYSGTQYLIF
jgi:hypothetical protein